MSYNKCTSFTPLTSPILNAYVRPCPTGKNFPLMSIFPTSDQLFIKSSSAASGEYIKRFKSIPLILLYNSIDNILQPLLFLNQTRHVYLTTFLRKLLLIFLKNGEQSEKKDFLMNYFSPYILHLYSSQIRNKAF